jgi:hypothetical protein
MYIFYRKPARAGCSYSPDPPTWHIHCTMYGISLSNKWINYFREAMLVIFIDYFLLLLVHRYLSVLIIQSIVVLCMLIFYFVFVVGCKEFPVSWNAILYDTLIKSNNATSCHNTDPLCWRSHIRRYTAQQESPRYVFFIL